MQKYFWIYVQRLPAGHWYRKSDVKCKDDTTLAFHSSTVSLIARQITAVMSKCQTSALHPDATVKVVSTFQLIQVNCRYGRMLFPGIIGSQPQTRCCVRSILSRAILRWNMQIIGEGKRGRRNCGKL